MNRFEASSFRLGKSSLPPNCTMLFPLVVTAVVCCVLLVAVLLVGNDTRNADGGLRRPSSKPDAQRVQMHDGTSMTGEGGAAVDPVSPPTLRTDAARIGPQNIAGREKKKNKWDWVRIEGKDPIRYLMWVPQQLLNTATVVPGTNTSDVTEGGVPEGGRLALQSWGVLVYLHGAGEAGDDLIALVDKTGAMGTPPQIIEGKCLVPPPSSASAPAGEGHGGRTRGEYSELHDGASAQPDTHPLRNGRVAASRMVVVAPQSLYGWPHDPAAMRALAERISSWMSTKSICIPVPPHASQVSLMDDGGRAVGVDPHRIFITGASQGGFAVLELAAQGLGSCFVSLCGFTTRDAVVAQGIAETVVARIGQPQHRGMPFLFLVHGRNDEFVPHDASDQVVSSVSRRVQRLLEGRASTTASGEQTNNAARDHEVGDTSNPQGRRSTAPVNRIVVPEGQPLSQALKHRLGSQHRAGRGDVAAMDVGGEWTGATVPMVLFADMEKTRDPLDILYSGHAAWRDAFAASSQLWNWMVL